MKRSNRNSAPSLGQGKKNIQHLQSTSYKTSAPSLQAARHPIPANVRFEVFQYDNFRCRQCGVSSGSGAVLEIDHIIPITKGGTNDRTNIKTLCQSCNLGKSNRIL